MYADGTKRSKVASCKECRKHKKGCSKDITGCISCKVKGVSCVYIKDPPQNVVLGMEDMIPVVNLINPITTMEVVGVQSNPYSTNQLLDRYMTNWNTSLVDLFTEMELEDPDLMATYQDWLLVYNHFTDNGLHRPKASYFDVESVLVEFHKKPPLL
ncbi:hypothetical protein HDU99_010724, partial [Rhizoclosmatium hyalinum]